MAKPISAYQDEWIARFLSTARTITVDQAKPLISKFYSYAGLEPPRRIIIVNSPTEAISIAKTEYGIDSPSFCNYGDISDYSWMSAYEIRTRLEADEKIPALENFLELLKLDYYTMIQLDECCIIVTNPSILSYIEPSPGRYLLHSTTGPAISWGDIEFDIYVINGRIIPSDIFTTPITQERFINETNVERKAAMYAILGPQGTLDLLNIITLDSMVIQHRDGRKETIELIRTVEQDPIVGNYLMWVKMVCPSTGTTYLIDCAPTFDNVLDAHASLTILDRDHILRGYTQHS